MVAGLVTADHFVGIDPGTRAGWAILDNDGLRVASGAWDCAIRRGEGDGWRIVRFCRHLGELLDAFRPRVVAYEEVRRHMGTHAAHLYGALVGQIMRTCEEHGIPYVPVPVGTVKRVATGKGNAKKGAMVESASARWGEPIDDDNEADALWIAECARTGAA
jgi:Holliday junction resolvasome RuvABC endonuclease subunit